MYKLDRGNGVGLLLLHFQQYFSYIVAISFIASVQIISLGYNLICDSFKYMLFIYYYTKFIQP